MKAEIQVGEVCPPEFSTGYKQPPQQEKGFAASTAAITGEAKRTINQHIARAEAIGDDLPRVHGTSLDKGVELVQTQTRYSALFPYSQRKST